MLKSQKVAAARIFDDLIKADRIVDTGEMDCWHRLCAKYEINRDIRMTAREISLAEAVTEICKADPSLQSELLADCRDMVVSDGFCAHPEALCMTALISLFGTGNDLSGRLLSIPRASFNIDLATALYIESDFDGHTNAKINENYRTIYKELQLAGFHFVYIPSIIEHYRNTDARLFNDILSFLAPGLSEEGVENASRSLLSMTTAAFTKDLLCNRVGITELRNVFPSMMIKIGNSFVADQHFANYLILDVDTDIVGQVRELVDIFTGMLSSDHYMVSSSEERDNQFHFHGFYKQLLDIFLIRRNVRSAVVLRPDRDEVFFPDIDMKAHGLNRRERALYALLLCAGPEGLNFSKPRSAQEFKAYERMLARTQKRYAAIYGYFGGDPATAPDLGVPEIRRPIVSRLRQSLSKLTALYNAEDYSVSTRKDKSIAVHVEPELIFVQSDTDKLPVPLQNSELYRIFTQI